MPLSSLNPRDLAAIDLGRVLSRLQHKILSADTADARLQHSSYERIKTSAVICPSSSFPIALLGLTDSNETLTMSIHQFRTLNMPALSSCASSIPPHPLNSLPKKPLPSHPFRLSAP